MPAQRKKKSLAKPFVITFAAPFAAALFGPGCMTTVNPPEIGQGGCPPSMPIAGNPCVTTVDCSYGVDTCGFPLSATCMNGVWQVESPVPCNPPPPDPQCPADIPAQGGPCNWNWQAGGGCTYPVDNDCGLQMISVMCNGTTMTAEYTAPSCGQCSALTEAQCATDSGCRWITPGCGMPALPMAGCFPITDCMADTDCTTAGQTCQEVSYDPCYLKACDACSAPAKVCLAAPGP